MCDEHGELWTLRKSHGVTSMQQIKLPTIWARSMRCATTPRPVCLTLGYGCVDAKQMWCTCVCGVARIKATARDDKVLHGALQTTLRAPHPWRGAKPTRHEALLQPQLSVLHSHASKACNNS